MSKDDGAPARRTETLRLSDREILRIGGEVLRKRLGRIGELRYLMLAAGGRDRFEDYRRQWAVSDFGDLERVLRRD